MHKHTIVILVFLYYILLTITAVSLGLTVTGGSSMAFPTLGEAPGILDYLAYVWAGLQIFFGLFTFSIAGVPTAITLIFVWLPTVYVLLYILGMIRGNE